MDRHVQRRPEPAFSARMKRRGSKTLPQPGSVPLGLPEGCRRFRGGPAPLRGVRRSRLPPEHHALVMATDPPALTAFLPARRNNSGRNRSRRGAGGAGSGVPRGPQGHRKWPVSVPAWGSEVRIPPGTGGLGHAAALASLGVASGWVCGTPQPGQSPKSFESPRGTGSGSHSGRSRHLARGQSREGRERPAHPTSSSGTRALSACQRWLVPFCHRGCVARGMAPRAPEGWHPRPCDEGAQSPVGVALRAPWGWHPDLHGDGTQGPAMKATRDPWGWHPMPCDEGAQSPLGMAPRAPQGRYSELHGDVTQSPVEMASRVPRGRHLEPPDDGTQGRKVVPTRVPWDGTQSPMGMAPRAPRGCHSKSPVGKAFRALRDGTQRLGGP